MCSGETPLETLDAMATKMEAKHPFSFLFYIQPYNTAGCAAASASGRCDDQAVESGDCHNGDSVTLGEVLCDLHV